MLPSSHAKNKIMKIDKHGFWSNNSLEGHWFDTNLATAIMGYIKGNTVVDLGCGHGMYTKILRINGIECDGFDGNPNTPALTDGICQVLDLSQDVSIDKVYDYVLCLEVGEHIPAIYEETFINNLDKLNRKGIILSWAVNGQGGAGHVNEHSNDYIRHIMEGIGYTSQPKIEQELREAAKLWWFKNTIMVFNR